MKHTVRNIAPGPRGINAVSGYVEIAPGQSITDLELTEAEFESAKGTGHFEFGKGTKGAPAPTTKPAENTGDLPKNVMQLRKIARDEQIDLGDASSVADIQAAIVAGRAAKAAAAAGGGGQADALDAMDDDALRDTVAVITGKPAPADADRATLLTLARGTGE